MMGPLYATPVARPVLDSFVEAEVTVDDDPDNTGFQMSFSIDKESPLQTLFLLTGGAQLLFMRVILIATVNGVPNVIMDGVITHHQILPGARGSSSTLAITGKDLSVLMGLQDFSGIPFPCLPPEARVAILVAKYSVLGIVPVVIPSVLLDEPLPIDNIPTQQGTDLQYIRDLAKQVGYVFYLDPGPQPGLVKAYWGPQVKVGNPQPALNTDMDAYTNVESLAFSFDATQNKIPTVDLYIEAINASIPVPVPSITPINPPLGLIPPIPTSIADLLPMDDNLSKFSFPRAMMIAMAQASLNAEAVTGEGTLDVVRYGRILKSRQLVGVRGAGPAYDGLHYVKRVTHLIKRDQYKQSFSLSRNGLLSTVSKVPT
jgi:hypothetical protein